MKRFHLIFLILLCISNKLRAQSMHDTISRENKLYALSLIWKEADYNFVFFDKQPHLNWDSLYIAYIPKIINTSNTYEYYKVLKSFLATLNDGHTSVMTNQNFWNDIDSPPVRYVKRGGRYFVTAVDTSLKNQVVIGSEIVKLDDKSQKDISMDDYWRGFKGTPVELTLLTPGKKITKVVVYRNINTMGRAHKLVLLPENKPAAAPKDFYYQSLSPSVAIVTINTFGDSSVVEDFKKTLPDLRKHKTLVLDIRNNQGGNDAYAIEIAKYLTDKPFMVGAMWEARTNNSANKAWAASWKNNNSPNPLGQYLTRDSWDKHQGDTIRIPDTLKRLKMPVYILTSKNTVSAAEDFLIYLNGGKNIITVGQNTAGSSGQPLYFDIPGGFSVRICAKRDAFPDGTDFIGTGINPNVYVEPFSSLTGEIKDMELDKTLQLVGDSPAKNN